MKIRFIKAAGFRGIRGFVDISVPDGFLVISGRNGSGKSTVCDAVEYALTGGLEKYVDSSEKGERISNYLWWRGANPPAERYVSVGLVDDKGAEFVVTRGPKGLIEPSERELKEKLCGADDRTHDLNDLCRTSIIRDENITRFSLDLPERDRVSFVRAAVGIDEFTRMEKKVDEATKTIEREREQIRDRYKKIRDRVTTYMASLSEMRSELSEDMNVASAEHELRTVLPAEEGDLAQLLNGARRIVTQYRREMDGIAEVLESLVSLNAQRDETDTMEFQAHLKAATEKVEELESRLENIRKEKADAEKDLHAAQASQPKISSLAILREHGERLGLQDDKCPLCGSMVSPEQFHQHLNKIHEYVEKQTSKITALVRKLAELEEQNGVVVRDLQETKGKRDALANRARLLRTQHEGLFRRTKDYGLNLPGMDALTVDVLRAGSDDRRKRIAALENNVAILEAARVYDRIADLEKELKLAQKESEQTEKKMEEIQSTYSTARRMRAAVKRLSGEIVDERLAALSPILTELYFRLRPHIDWEEISYKMRGDIRHFLSLRVGGDLDLNPRFMFSSGQRRALGLAFLLALHLSRPWCQLDSLVLDDPIQHIDDYRALHLVEVLSGIRRTGRQVICALEDSALADLLCRRLRSQQYGDGRRVEMEYILGEGVGVRQTMEIAPFQRAVLLSA